MARNVAVLVGSLRKESFSRKLANALILLTKPTLDMHIVEIGDLPLYNEDMEQRPPQTWKSFRDAIRPVDGVLFVTPEYDRSVPGCLKNAIDVGSQPEAYISGSNKLVNDNGEIDDQSRREYLTKIMQSFASWIEKIPK